MNRRTYIKTAIALCISLCVVLGSMGFWIDYQATKALHVTRLQNTKAIAEALATAVEADLLSVNLTRLESHLNQAISNPQVAEVAIIDTDGQILGKLSRTQNGSKTFSLEHKRIPLDAKNTPKLDDSDNMHLQIPINSAFPVGWVDILMSENIDNTINNSIHHQIILALLVSGLSMIVAMYIVLRVNFARIQKHHTALEESREALQHAALYDALTGLPNRYLLDDHLRKAMAQSRRNRCSFALIFLDLDNLKPINDQFGHEVGDLILQETATRISQCIRQVDTGARLGGDEFVLLINDVTSLNVLNNLMSRLLPTLCAPFTINNQEIPTGASMGVAIYPDDASESSLLMDFADQALYRAKRMGKNQWCLYRDQVRFQYPSQDHP